ncbi:MAG: enoyl-CoA hydratase/isomerase family protein [Alphaproteobacteria bacterium]|nr:enoyl-CoA hydratase/isomerase family protein [Alphaproteobacteria bacterium]
MSGEAEILFEQRGQLGLITLNRPRALNALTHGMCVAMREKLASWSRDDAVRTVAIRGTGERAFCAGGDIRSLYEAGKSGSPDAIDFYREEYLLDAAIKHLAKPYVAFMGGIVMGGGVGVSVNGQFRVAEETTMFAMPETGIGLFPDVGGSFFLPRLPGAAGMYLALTGTRLGASETVAQGLATHIVPRENREDVLERLAAGIAPAVALSELQRPLPEPASPQIDPGKIDSVFSAPSVHEILERLAAADTDWSRSTEKVIRTKSPTSTCLAFRQIREGAKLDFDSCMRMEFRMVNRVMAGHDFYEGVRATIIDKDNRPQWRPAELSEVDDAQIDSYFAPLENELPL